MTGQYGKPAHRQAQSAEFLDDPLVATWDAVVRGDRETPEGCDPSDTALLRQFHALESIPPPSDAFFADLERQLVLLEPRHANPNTASAPPLPRGGATGSWASRTRSHRPLFFGTSRRVRWSAAAVIALLLVAGPLVFYLTHTGPAGPPAIPAAVIVPPAIETLIQLDYASPLWGMPPAAAWEQMEFSMFQVDPGATFSTDTPWYTSVDGPMLIVALNGNLIIQPAGPARVFRHGADTSAENPPGTAVTLGPNDAIAFSSVAAAKGSNPGSEPVRALYGSAGVFDDQMQNNIVDAHDVTRIDVNYESHLLLPSDGAAISIQHLRLAPLDTFIYERDPGWKLLPMYLPLQINDLRIYDGAADAISPDILADARYASLAKMKFPEPGPHTLINIGSETIDLYFLVIEPYPNAATPAA